jgi:hypothetical protein
MPSWYRKILTPAIQVLRTNKTENQLQENVQILTGRKKIVYHKFTRSHGNYSLDLQATERKVKNKIQSPSRSAKSKATTPNGDLVAVQLDAPVVVPVSNPVDDLFGDQLNQVHNLFSDIYQIYFLILFRFTIRNISAIREKQFTYFLGYIIS